MTTALILAPRRRRLARLERRARKLARLERRARRAFARLVVATVAA